MLPGALTQPHRVLMTLDAVGGVWRYAVDLARGLAVRGIDCLLVGLGPRGDVAFPEGLQLVWIDAPLDWLVGEDAELDAIPARLSALAGEWRADLLHCNLISQAVGLGGEWPVVVAAHSCVPTWWEAVRGTPLPAPWAWLHRRNRRGLDRADAVLAPSAGHAAALSRLYGGVERLHVVANAAERATTASEKRPFILAAGRWWDEGKNAATLDRAAARSAWPVVMAGPRAGPDGQVVEIRHARAAGTLGPEPLRAMMRRAAIFAAPSRYEPFGLAVLEAALSHAALVLADIAVFRELWDGAAWFVPPMDADGFARAFAALACDAGLRARLGALAAVRAQHFSASRQMTGVLDAYAAAMSRHRPSARGAA